LKNSVVYLISFATFAHSRKGGAAPGENAISQRIC
jgi:hypothetical protein